MRRANTTMYAERYFAPRYFAGRYFAGASSASGEVFVVTRQSIDLDDHQTGDTFPGKVFTVLDDNDDPVDISGATIEMQFRSGKRLVGTLDTNSGVSFVSATDGTFRIDEQVISYAPGVLVYDAQVTTADGKVYTVASGRWVILQEVTQ